MANLSNDVNLKLNQNLWGLLLSLGALGASEYFHLYWLQKFSFGLTIISALSYVVTLTAYTYDYAKRKFKK